METVDLAKKYPLQFVQDGVIANGNGDITMFYNVDLQSVFTRSEEDFNIINKNLSDIFRTLPAGALVHQLDLVWPTEYEPDFDHAYDFSTLSDLKHWHRKPVLNHQSFIGVTLSERKAKPFQGAVRSAIYGSFDYIFSGKPFKGKSKLADYSQVFETFETMLKSADGFQIKRCSTNEILNLIYKFHSWDFDNDEETKWLDATIPPVELNKDHFTIGDNHFKVVSLDKQGSEVATANTNKPSNMGISHGTSDRVRLPVSFNYALTLGLPIKHMVSTSIEIIDNDVAAATLDAQAGWLKFLKGVSNAASMKYESNTKFKNLLFEEDFQAVNLGVNLILAESSEQKLTQSLNLARLAFNRLNGATAWAENLECFPAYMYSLPGNRKDWERNRLTVMEVATCYLTKESHFLGDTEGFYYLDRYGRPVLVNFWYNDHVNNVNMVIIGPSGSGKSYFSNGLLLKCLAINDEIIIIDDGDSYERLCQGRGKYLDSRNKETLGVNIFNWRKTGNKEEDEEILLSRRNLIYSIIKIIWKGSERISNDERAVIKEVILEFVDDETPTVQRNAAGFFKFLKGRAEALIKAKDIKAAKCDFHGVLLTLKAFIQGEYDWIFQQSDTDKRLDEEQLVVFSLAGISDDEVLSPIYTLIVIDQIIEKVKRLPLGVRKRLFIDEAWKVLDGDMKEYVEYSFRTMRKMNAQVCIITQNAADIENSSIADAIKINTDIKVLLGHGNQISDDMQLVLRKALGLNSRDLSLLESMQKSTGGGRELFVKMGNHPFVLINEVSPESNLIFTTHASELATLNEYKAIYGDDYAAINEMIYQNTLAKEN